MCACLDTVVCVRAASEHPGDITAMDYIEPEAGVALVVTADFTGMPARREGTTLCCVWVTR